MGVTASNHGLGARDHQTAGTLLASQDVCGHKRLGGTASCWIRLRVPHLLLVRGRRTAISPRLLSMIPGSHTIGTDGPPSGFGGMCRGRHYCGAWSPGPGSQGLLTATGSPTVFMEFLSGLFGVQLHGARFAGSLRRVFCDNAGVVQDWQPPSSPAAQAMIRALARELAVCAVYPGIAWIPTTEANVFPDHLSRQSERVGSNPQLDAAWEQREETTSTARKHGWTRRGPCWELWGQCSPPDIPGESITAGSMKWYSSAWKAYERFLATPEGGREHSGRARPPRAPMTLAPSGACRSGRVGAAMTGRCRPY